jgi:hypothetical protein
VKGESEAACTTDRSVNRLCANRGDTIIHIWHNLIHLLNLPDRYCHELEGSCLVARFSCGDRPHQVRFGRK